MSEPGVRGHIMVAGRFIKVVGCFSCGEGVHETEATRYEEFFEECLGGHKVNIGPIWVCNRCEGREE